VLTASQLVLDSLHEHPNTEATAGACQEREKKALALPLRPDDGNKDDLDGLPPEDKLRRVLLIAVRTVGGRGRRRSIIYREP
jgi:hypothetical protein